MGNTSHAACGLLGVFFLCLVGTGTAEARGAGTDTFRVRDGKTVRQMAAGNHSNPTFLDLRARRVFSAEGSIVVARDLAGKEKWRHDLGIQKSARVMGASVASPTVLCVWTYGRVTGIDRASGKQVYRLEDGRDATVRERAGHVYLIDRGEAPRVRQLDPTTGKVRWMARPLTGKHWMREIGDGWIRSGTNHYAYFDPASGNPRPVSVPDSTTRCLVAGTRALFVLHAASSRLDVHGLDGARRWSMPVPKHVDRLLPDIGRGRLALGSAARVEVVDLHRRRVSFGFPFPVASGGSRVLQLGRHVVASSVEETTVFVAATGTVAWRAKGGWRAVHPGRAGEILDVEWHASASGEKGNGRARLRSVATGAVRWSWPIPDPSPLARIFAGVRGHAEPDGTWILHRDWHVLD